MNIKDLRKGQAKTLKSGKTDTQTHTHTHTYIYIYI